MSITVKPRARPMRAVIGRTERTVWICRCTNYVGLGSTLDKAVENWRSPKGRTAIEVARSTPFVNKYFEGALS